MKIQSSLTSCEYLRYMKDQMGSSLAFYSDRFTGRFLGPFFYVTHHTGKDFYDRRTGLSKNGVIGIVRPNEEGCQVRFFRVRGFLCPGSFLTLLLIFGAILLFAVSASQKWDNQYWKIIALFWGIVFLSALLSNKFEEGREGEKALNALLLDPSDPFSYSNHQSEI